MDGLNVSQGVINAYSTDLKNKAAALQKGQFVEHCSNTIQVNSKIASSFTQSDNVIYLLKENTNQEAENIKHVGDELYSADEHISRAFG